MKQIIILILLFQCCYRSNAQWKEDELDNSERQNRDGSLNLMRSRWGYGTGGYYYNGDYYGDNYGNLNNQFYWDGYQYRRTNGNNNVNYRNNQNINPNYQDVRNLDKNRNRQNGCKDGGSDCPIRKYLCDNNIYRDFMADECPLTCGKC